MSRSRIAFFLDNFVYWYGKLPQPRLEQKSIDFHIKIIHISESLNKLSLKGREQEGLIFIFRSTDNIKSFIKNKLELSTNHAKWAWFIKGVLLAHQEYNFDKYIKKKKGVTMYKYFNALIYHLWFWKGQVEARKCIQFVTKYVN